VRHYATCARARELPVLLASMRKHCRPFVLHVLAWDYDPVGMPFWLPHHDDDPGATVVRVNYTTRGAFLARHPDLEPSRLPGPPRSAVDVVATVRWAFFGDVMESTGEPLVIDDTYFLPPDVEYTFNRSLDEKYGYRTKSMMTIPMKDHKDEVIGVLPEHFNKPELAHSRLTRLELVDGMHTRKARMAELADAVRALRPAGRRRHLGQRPDLVGHDVHDR